MAPLPLASVHFREDDEGDTDDATLSSTGAKYRLEIHRKIHNDPTSIHLILYEREDIDTEEWRQCSDLDGSDIYVTNVYVLYGTNYCCPMCCDTTMDKLSLEKQDYVLAELTWTLKMTFDKSVHRVCAMFTIRNS